MSRRILLSLALIVLGALPAGAQTPFPQDLVPTRSSLAKLGLERAWMAVVPVTKTERVLLISMAGGRVFAQTNMGRFHAYDAETGQHLWSAELGNRTVNAVPVSVNSFGVYVTNLSTLHALDIRTGRRYWSTDLLTLPSSSTACDEERVMVGLSTGKLLGYDLKVKKNNKTTIAGEPREAWNWQANAPIETRPLAAGRFVAFGSEDGKLYVTMADERTMLYRIATGGPIGRGFGTYGDRRLLVPSGDNNLYSIDMFTSNIQWKFPTGSPIKQEPLVADKEIFVVNSAGRLYSLDPETGQALWITPTEGGRLLAVGATRIYMESHDEDLFIIDRTTGKITADPQSTRSRAGLNLRYYDLGFTNRENDRLYFSTSSGMIIALREIGATSPRPVRDPKSVPFGTVPPEGVSLVPKPAEPPADAPAEGDAPPAEEKPEGEATDK